MGIYFGHEIMSLITNNISYQFDGIDVIIWYSFGTSYSIYVKRGNCNNFFRIYRTKTRIMLLMCSHFEFLIIYSLNFLNEKFLNNLFLYIILVSLHNFGVKEQYKIQRNNGNSETLVLPDSCIEAL